MIPHKDVTVAQLHHALVRLFQKSAPDLPNYISINLERAKIENRPTEFFQQNFIIYRKTRKKKGS